MDKHGSEMNQMVGFGGGYTVGYFHGWQGHFQQQEESCQ